MEIEKKKKKKENKKNNCKIEKISKKRKVASWLVGCSVVLAVILLFFIVFF